MTWLWIIGGSLVTAGMWFAAARLGIHPYAEPYLGEPEEEDRDAP